MHKSNPTLHPVARMPYVVLKCHGGNVIYIRQSDFASGKRLNAPYAIFDMPNGASKEIALKKNGGCSNCRNRRELFPADYARIVSCRKCSSLSALFQAREPSAAFQMISSLPSMSTSMLRRKA